MMYMENYIIIKERRKMVRAKMNGVYKKKNIM